MAKPRQTAFGEEFEPIILRAWGTYQEQLSGNYLQRTREAIALVRRTYRFKSEDKAQFPSSKLFSRPEYRAGYIGAFGQRHAYLSYVHLKQIQDSHPQAIPNPNAKGVLTVTSLGAGPAVEIYGLLYFFNEPGHNIKELRLNLVETVVEWQPVRDDVMHLLQKKFPKVQIYHKDIEADLTESNCVEKFSHHHDSLIDTDILVIYNVLNEIEVKHAETVFRNLSYVLRQCVKPLLLIIAEPTAPKAWPRVNWLLEQLMECSTVLQYESKATINFTKDPIKIAFEEKGTGLNDRLFGREAGKNPPALETTLKRVLMACQLKPLAPFSAEFAYEQFRRLKIRRIKKGRFAPQQASDGQLAFPKLVT